jgi:hypothetical protein
MIAIASWPIRYLVRTLSMGALGAALAFSVAACNNQSGFSGSVGSTPNVAPLASYQILGTTGTSFNATVSDARSSWTFSGVVPLSVVIINDVLPASVVATKTASDNSLLSLEIIKGSRVSDLQSTTAPFGTVSVMTGGTLKSIPPPASPDLRIFDSGPLNEHYSALVEDQSIGFVINATSPTLILFDTPNGKVDATFFGSHNFGAFTLNMTLNGNVVASIVQGPNATIREP